MTEKIARELFNESRDEITIFIHPLFSHNRLMEVMRIIQERHVEITNEVTAKQLQEYKDKVQECRIKYKQKIASIKHSNLLREDQKRVLNFAIEDYL